MTKLKMGDKVKTFSKSNGEVVQVRTPSIGCPIYLIKWQDIPGATWYDETELLKEAY